MKKKNSIILACLICFTHIIYAQESSLWFKRSPWLIGIGVNIVDDNNYQFQKLFDAKHSWNIPPYPTRVNVEKVLKYGISVEGIANYNVYNKNNIILGTFSNYKRNFFSFDVMAKYDLNEWFGETYWFDPFVTTGFGFSSISAEKQVKSGDIQGKAQNGLNYNVGFGFNLWITEEIGVGTQALGKFGLGKLGLGNKNDNYTQYSFSVIYRFTTSIVRLAKRSIHPNNMVDHYKKIKRKTDAPSTSEKINPEL
jgi:hypothetical protein